MSEAILAEARRWLGTPYIHQASQCGAGCDCLGLIRGIWRAVIGPEHQPVPPYTPDWAEEQGEETLLMAARRSLVEIDRSDTRNGDVLAFRYRPDLPVKHVGILSAHDHFIHAYHRRGVVESAFVSFWRKRHTHSFRFPEVRP